MAASPRTTPAGAADLHAHPETPRDAYGLLSRTITWTVVGLLLILAGVAWFSTVRTAEAMRGMVGGLGQVGSTMDGMAMRDGIAVTAGSDSMVGSVFISMWVLMMVAMMFPTVAPVVLAHRAVVRKRGEGSMPTIAFVGGYLFVWAVIGIVPMLALLTFENLSADALDSRWLPALAGGVLLVAGLYQFTRWKALCLKACRSPMTFMMTHDWGGGSRSAFRSGVSNGLFCLGCCWALMAVLVVVGLMNLVWMAILTIIFLAEKNWRHGVALTKVAGAGIAALGVAVALAPSILPVISRA